MPAGAICRDNPSLRPPQRPAGAQAQPVATMAIIEGTKRPPASEAHLARGAVKVSAKNTSAGSCSGPSVARLAPTAPTTLATEAMAPIDTRFVTPRFLMRVGNQKPQA